MFELVTAPTVAHPSTRGRCEVCGRDADEVRRFRCVRGSGFAVVVRICTSFAALQGPGADLPRHRKEPHGMAAQHLRHAAGHHPRS